MVRSGSSQPIVFCQGLRKAIRKGTRSCVECRRRKIRCYFKEGISDCHPCIVRGSSCIDQTHERETIKLAAVTRRGVTPQKQSAGCSSPAVSFTTWAADNVSQHEVVPPSRRLSVDCSDTTPQVNSIDDRVPLMSVLIDAELLQYNANEHCTDVVASSNVPQIARDPVIKTNSVCETLRSALPSYDTVVQTLAKNGAWWNSFRSKMRAFSESPVTETIEAFAARTYISSNPGELGTLTVAFAYSAGNLDRLYALIESLVISKLAYSATAEGMECLILLAKVHTDIGQPRKAWILWRQALTYAQLMGLYQISVTSPIRRSLWWEIYLGDRFTSLLLGLSYGFNDAHYDKIMIEKAMQSWSSTLCLSFKGAILAGKVIDRNMSPAKPSFAHAMDSDEQMVTMATSMPDDWWKLPGEPVAYDTNIDDLRERLLLQFYFFHIKLYIHLPFVGHSFPEWSREVSRPKCIEAARELLRRYNMFRVEIHGACLFECKTSDFIGFTALIVLMLCLSRSSDKVSRPYLNDDAILVAATESIFEKQEKRGCKIASQCRKTLQLLFGRGSFREHTRHSSSVRIPYFGTVVRRFLRATSLQPLFTGSNNNTSNISFSGPTPVNLETPANQVPPLLMDMPGMENLIFDSAGLTLDGSIWDVEKTFEGEACSWLDSGMLDIDQDWFTLQDIP